MIRHWSLGVVSTGLLAMLAACGDVGHTAIVPLKEAGKDSTAPLGNDGEDASFVEDASSLGDATVDDGASDDAEDASAGDASDDVTDAGTPDGGPNATEAGATDDAGHDGGPSNGGPDAGPDASVPDAGPRGDGGACDFAGKWGAKITIDVTWAAGGLLDIVIAPGSGTITQWVMSTRTQSGNTVTDTAVVCGIQLPDFQGNAQLVNETYGIRFPNSLFDNGTLTSFTMNGTVSGSSQTATYATTPTAALLGLTLANATTAVWPSTITTEVDQDNDTKPGITANVVAPGGGFSYVPLDISVVSFPKTVARADQLYVAIRQVTSVNAQFTDCDHASGSVTVPQISDSSAGTKKYAIDSQVIGCRVNGSNTDCSASQTNFVDENQPVFVPMASTFTSTRLGSGATCATVRALP